MEYAELYVQQSFMYNAMDIDLKTLLLRKVKDDSDMDFCMDKIK